jgi:polyhydroxyalkanoate synthase subunit PhaC
MATTTAATRRTTKKPKTAPPRRTPRKTGPAAPRRIAKQAVAAAPRPVGKKATASAPRPARKKATAAAPTELALSAARNTLAANPLVGIRRKEVLSAASTLLTRLASQPRAVSRQYAKFLGELLQVAAGRSALAPAGGDRRFADKAWSDSATFRRLLQAYVALGRTLDACVDDAHLDATGTDRARFVVSLLVDAMAPTNFIVTNPAALKKAVDTKGVSVIRGLANLVEDLAGGTFLPKQVDARPFTVGRNLANTAGAVVFRNDVLELIQYKPTSPQVHQRPLLIVPPQINKYYVFDLVPAKSIVQWSLGSGVQTFIVSWRNPTREHADWGLDAYVGALEEAVDAMREITGSADVNVWGACSGGITLTAFVAYLAARRTRKIHAATMAVCVLDMSAVRQTTAGLFVTPATIKAAKAASRKRGVVEGTDLARMFAWMRPNDLIWNYVVNNYLLGNDPPAYDILVWNNDTTRLPAQLHADFLELMDGNPFAHPGRLTVRGRKIDMSKIGIDTYIVGGLADHITPWQGVYQTARLYGGTRSTFALSNGGHIQSLVNPPGNTRSWYMAGPARAATPEAWLKRGEKVEGSWWPHWREWVRARSGAMRPAPAAVGSARHAPLCAAPGTYVLER